jgi:Zn-dependent protease
MLNLFFTYSGTTLVIAIIAFILAMFLAFGMHEFAHAFIAHKEGDDTAKVLGRMTINPLAHFDMVGLICLILFGFGWGKPVPINPTNFKDFKKGNILVSLAGIITNLILMIITLFFEILYNKLTANIQNLPLYIECIGFFLSFFSSINLYLAVFNLLPIYPLDGFMLIASLVKKENKFLQFMQRYGNIILIIILVFPISYDLTLFDVIAQFVYTIIAGPFLKLFSLILL